MDFDKLKRAAKETFRIMTGKGTDEDEPLFDDEEPESDFDLEPDEELSSPEPIVEDTPPEPGRP